MNQSEKKASLIRGCVEDPLFLGKTCLPKLFSMTPADFHRDIASCLTDPNDLNHNIIAPRGHAKTTVTAICGPIWHIFCEDYYFGRPKTPKFVLLVSRSRGHAVNLLTTIKNQLEYSQEFKTLFGYHGSAVAEKWSEDFVILDDGSIIMCRGMRQMVRGLNVHGTRPTLIAADDAEDEENTKTPERMEANLRWFLQALLESGAKGCRTINIGTPQNERCIVMTLPDMSGWKSRHYKAINLDENGNEYALWPELRPLKWLKAKKKELEDIGRASVFYKEYQCEVIGDEDQLFPPHVIQRWKGEFFRDGDGKGFLKMPDEKIIPVNIFMGVDPASSISTNADFSCLMVIAIDKEGNRYVVDMVRKRMTPLLVGDALMKMNKKYKPEKVQIETTGYQAMLAEYVRKESEVFIPGAGIKNNPRRGKTERLEGLQPLFWKKQVFIREGPEYGMMEHFIAELNSFPRAKHDDTLDAFWYANKGAYRPYHESPTDREAKERQSRSRRRYNWMIE